MLYYKVKLTADQIRKGIRTKTGFLIKDELYTSNEIEKAISENRIDYGFVKNHFIRLQISKHQTYWFFGARFQCSIQYGQT